MAEIKLFRPQRLTDNPNGGGMSTGQEVVDGEVNNLFDDIGDIDRTNGNVSLRKGFVQADTDNVETFINLHVIIADAPIDALVSMVMFSVPAWGSERAEAKNVMERYVDPSVATRMIPYDRQLEGQRTLLLFARPEQALPDIGQIFFLEDGITGEREAVRVQDRSAVEETFTDPQYGDYRANVITVTISQPLKRDYVGSEPNRYFRQELDRSLLRRSLASDAARFKGVVRLAADAPQGATEILLESVFAPIVPAATSELPIIDSPPPGVLAIVPAVHWNATDDATKRAVDSPTFDTGARLNWGSPVAPGSVRAVFSNSETVRDAGDGTFAGLPEAMGQMRIDYDTGSIYALNPSTAPSRATVQAHPAAAISKSPFSSEFPVTQSNRGAVWTALLRPLPAPGATVLSFRALGRWYELRDQGDGILRGDAGTGVGSINFATGTLSATLGYLPDEGTSVLVNWGIAQEYRAITGLTPAVAPDGGTVPEFQFTLPVGGIEPGSFAFRFNSADVEPHVQDDGSGGLEPTVYGTAYGVSGTINYSTGEVVLKSLHVPAMGTIGRATWEGGATEDETFNATRSGSTVTLALASAPLAPRTLSLMYQQEIVTQERSIGYVHRLRDDGNGALEDLLGNPVPGSSVNYTTGLVTFNPDFSIEAPQYNYGTVDQQLPGREAGGSSPYEVIQRAMRIATGIDIVPISISFMDGTAIIARYRRSATAPNANTHHVTFSTLRLDLTAGSILPLVPGSVSFFANANDWYVERGGSLYRNVDPLTNAGALAGSLDLSSGVATITNWGGGFIYSPRVTGGLVSTGQLHIPLASGRMPGSPVRPGSFSLRALRASDGQEIVGSANVNGNIDTADMHGRIDVNSGVWTVAFGRYLLNSALTEGDKLEPWYDASLIDSDGYVWRPAPVLPGSIRYNGVIQVSTPLDPSIIGLNPVRLPLDGRGQIVRPADTLVLLESLPFTMPVGLAAGQVVELPRGGLDSVSVYDQAGLGVPDTFFVIDRSAGEIQMATPLNLSGYQQPLVAIHRVGEPLLVTDVGINGRVAVAQPLSRGYDADITTASTALVIGNVAARYENLFEQNTWLSQFSDDVIDGPPISGAQYNELLYPVLVTNHGAITQRWALVFLDAASGNIVGEEMGIIGTFDLVNPVAPLNPATIGTELGSAPYFQLSPSGFGTGWATGNVVRFNTYAAGAPIWLARTVRPGASGILDDRARLQLRWNKD